MDKFDLDGNGLRDQGFVGEDWTHLTVQALYDIVEPRVIGTFCFDDQLVFQLTARHD
jgi:hypothetical protein